MLVAGGNPGRYDSAIKKGRAYLGGFLPRSRLARSSQLCLILKAIPPRQIVSGSPSATSLAMSASGQ